MENKEKQVKKAKSYLKDKPFKVIYEYIDLKNQGKLTLIKEIEYPEYIPSFDVTITFDGKLNQLMIVMHKYFNEPANILYIICADSEKYLNIKYPNNLK